MGCDYLGIIIVDVSIACIEGVVVYAHRTSMCWCKESKLVVHFLHHFHVFITSE